MRRWFFVLGAVALALLAAVIGAFVIGGWAAFGSEPTGARLARAQASPQWHDGHFEDPQTRWTNLYPALLRLVTGTPTPDVTPGVAIPVVHENAATFAVPPASGLRVTWFGHSSTLVEIDGVRALIDPLSGERPSPVQWLGPQRWYAPPIALKDLPPIDVVVISHDHYDHLDQTSIVTLNARGVHFIVPLGIGAHLVGWGVPENRITELDWWQSAHIGNLELVATPSRHSSGRMALGSDETLWAGFALIGPHHRLWYSGDTGFHNDLARIGERFGPFDVTLIEAGQYDEKWPDNHLGPEQAVEANRLVGGKVMIPVHWGLLKLAEHAWTEPVERVLVAAKCRGLAVLTPRPGESIEPTEHPVTAPWWPQTQWRSAAERPIRSTKNGVPSDRVEISPCTETDAQP